MKKTLRQLMILFVVIVLAFSFVACAKGETTDEATTTKSDTKADDTTKDADVKEVADVLMHGTVDLTEQANIVYYHLGDDKEDMDMVLDYVNENILIPELNSTLEVKFLPWSDWQTQYSLTLQGGDQVDLIYTSDWAYYPEEAAKGAFKELTMDFIKDTMPLTYEKQATPSWTEVQIGGKMFAVPQSRVAHNQHLAIIRDDLRMKYGLDPVETIEDYKAYLIKVAEEDEVIAYNADASGFDGFTTMFYIQLNNYVDLSLDMIYKYPGNDDSASVDDIFYKFEDPEYMDYLYEMKALADAGVVPKNTLNNDVNVEDSYDNGQSASIIWNLTVYKHGVNARTNNSEWVSAYVEDAEFYLPMKYSNDCIAITTVSEQPERAAVVLDFMKFDPETSFILRAGLEDVHYTIDGNTYRGIPDAVQNFPVDSWTWALRPTEDYFLGEVEGFYKETGDGTPEYDLQLETIASYIQSYTESPKMRSFKFDESTVKAEVAAMDAIIQQYEPALAYGLVDDVDATVAEFLAALEKAGLETFRTEYMRQAQEFISANY